MSENGVFFFNVTELQVSSVFHPTHPVAAAASLCCVSCILVHSCDTWDADLSPKRSAGESLASVEYLLDEKKDSVKI